MGRTIGALNKNKDRLLRMLKETYGADFDPIMKMSEIASKEENEDGLKLQAWKEIAQYVYPKLKAVEVDLTADIQLSDLTEEALDRKLRELIDASSSE